MTLQEAAEYLGIQRESARRLLARHGVKHGYPRSEVETIERRKGRRSDLENKD